MSYSVINYIKISNTLKLSKKHFDLFHYVLDGAVLQHFIILFNENWYQTHQGG